MAEPCSDARLGSGRQALGEIYLRCASRWKLGEGERGWLDRAGKKIAMRRGGPLHRREWKSEVPDMLVDLAPLYVFRGKLAGYLTRMRPAAWRMSPRGGPDTGASFRVPTQTAEKVAGQDNS